MNNVSKRSVCSLHDVRFSLNMRNRSDENNYDDFRIKNNEKQRALPIGGLMLVSNLPIASNKLIALKQNNGTYFIISHIELPACLTFYIYKCVHNIPLEN